MSDDYLSKPLSLGSASTTEDRGGNKSNATAASSTFTSTFNSPYLNYDPRFLQQAQPEFIFPEGASKQRGRFELAFSQIGFSVMAGAGVGGLAGFYNGLQTTKAIPKSSPLWRTQMINHIMKQGSGTANTLGTLAVMYSALGVIIQYVRGSDDDVNTLVAGAATGMLYKSTAGLRKSAIGGAVGVGLSGLYCLYQISRGNPSNFQL